jgi:hypothetical protein
MALPATDTFLQTTGSPQGLATYNASWTVSNGACNVPTNTGTVEGSVTELNLAYWNADTFSTEQYWSRGSPSVWLCDVLFSSHKQH